MGWRTRLRRYNKAAASRWVCCLQHARFTAAVIWVHSKVHGFGSRWLRVCLSPLVADCCCPVSLGPSALRKPLPAISIAQGVAHACPALAPAALSAAPVPTAPLPAAPFPTAAFACSTLAADIGCVA